MKPEELLEYAAKDPATWSKDEVRRLLREAATAITQQQQDAERYRCLREKCAWTLTSGPDGTRISAYMPGVDVTAIGPGEDEFDAAIDAAMRK